MEEWLTVIIVLLIAAIVLDGLRRMRISRRENIQLSKNAKKADLVEDMPVGSGEFPSGGARVASYRDENDAHNLNESVRRSYEAGRVTAGAPQRIPQQVSLHLEESVPMLMDSVDEAEPEASHSNVAHTEDLTQTVNESPDIAESADNEIIEEPIVTAEPIAEPSVTEQSIAKQVLDDSSASNNEPRIGSLEGLQDELESPAADKTSSLAASSKAANKAASVQEPAPEDAAYHEPDEVLIMNVMAKSGTRFSGSDLLDALMHQGLKFGDMDIFHRHLDNDGDGPVLFSLANMVVPGTFNLATMKDFETPGVSLFLSLPVAGGESLAAYNDLAQTSRGLAEMLGGELKDENRSVMTSQTIEHGRQRVMEYERKRKLAKA